MTREPVPDSAGVHLPPPLFYVAVLGVGLLLERQWPQRLLPRAVAPPLAYACLLGWAAIAAWAFTHFYRARTNVLPSRPSSALITAGPFRFSRNPLYLALLLLYLAVTLWVNTLWPLLLAPGLVALVQQAVIVKEERYLERTFGDAYRAYRARVRRWI